jgi:molybdopterin/thiamine biosynthesis adenylyltransferase
MIDLVLASDDLDAIRDELTGGDVETCAVLYASRTARSDGNIRLLVREVQFPQPDDYSRRGPLTAELKPEFVARITKRAAKEAHAIVFVHSHLGADPPVFSFIDCEGEERLAAFLSHRHPSVEHAALVISRGGMRARRLGTEEPIRIVAVGNTRDVLFDPMRPTSPPSDVFDRQVRAFGAAGQKSLEALRIAIVGLGGTGSIVAQQLVHLGVRDFILVDADTIESTNLNRVANAEPTDIGKPKVDVAARYIRSVAADAAVTSVQGDIIRTRTAKQLLNADIIFGCTDSHGSRAVLQQVSYQYVIPCIDMGMTIVVAEERVTHIYGRIQWLAPGFACMTCGGLLNAAEVRRDMMTAFERQADPYLQGAREPAPSVMSLNGTVASLAVTMLLAVVCGVPVKARHLLYNGIASALRSVRAEPDPTCYVCSRSGSFARGDAWPLLGRQD